ncbi:MAG: nitronate monooxygenase [Propionibacteriaceae bacterium]|nr:nitronate monooxygenase [Propionibacteriaceae bacterium]
MMPSLPLVQAPMAGVQGSALALAVSGAGALGSLPAAMLSDEALTAELSVLAASELPYNVNFFAHQMPAPDPAADDAWVAALAPYRAEFGVAETGSTASRRPFDEGVCGLVEPFAPPIVSFHFGLPDEALLRRVKAWGAVVMSTATTVDEARWLVAHGADVVIAQGWEAGGHRGHFLSMDPSLHRPTLELVRAVKAAVDAPVVAAGGITTAEHVRAALDAGALSVQVGTAFLLADEATTSPFHREALLQPHETVVTTAMTGRPARGIPNRLINDLGAFPEAVPPFPRAAGAIAPLKVAAEARGRADFTSMWCGTSTEGLRAAPAAEIVAELTPRR